MFLTNLFGRITAWLLITLIDVSAVWLLHVLSYYLLIYSFTYLLGTDISIA
jgi:hypothetical protein